MSTSLFQLPDHAVIDVRPGDQTAADAVEGWLQAYVSSRDPELRQQIILPTWAWPTGWPTAIATAVGLLART